MTLIDVVVPVLGRPGRAEPFMASLRASLPGECGVRVTVMASQDDPLTSVCWADAIATHPRPPDPGPPDLLPPDLLLVTGPERRSFACKVNDAYRATSAPWLLLVGDDVAFHPGWWQALLPVMASGWAEVIGTNDDGWRADAQSCVHPVISRGYVDRRGASWDGPGVVCHEGYHHNYVDAEVHMVAHDRGVFAPCPGAVIEHLHHSFGRAPVDATYERGAQWLQHDRRLYNARLARYRAT